MKTNLDAISLNVLAAIILGSKGYIVNNRGKMIEVLDGLRRPMAKIKATKLEIDTYLRYRVLAEFGNQLIWVPFETQVSLLARGFTSNHIKVVPPGTTVVAMKVSGTYFGSGSYSASWGTNVPQELHGKKESRDTGFAVENFTDIPMSTGSWVWHSKSASPGGGYKCIHICN